jgi:lipopolysaccharide export LptBFGC system permease protein LptF
MLFESFDYSFDVSEMLSGEAAPVFPKQMTLAELQDVVARGRAGDPLDDLRKQEPVLYELEIHRRFALPVAPLLFALAAVPVALIGRRGSRAWGPIACVSLAFAYYAIGMLLQFLARQGWLAPALAFWIPNFLLAALSVHPLRRTGLGVAA